MDEIALWLKNIGSVNNSGLEKCIVVDYKERTLRGGELRAFEFRVLAPAEDCWLIPGETYESLCGQMSLHCNKNS
jgi:hypothetical protein